MFDGDAYAKFWVISKREFTFRRNTIERLSDIKHIKVVSYKYKPLEFTNTLGRI